MPSEDQMNRYAELALTVGLALDPGRRLTIRAPIDMAPLARRIARSAYQRGAPYVRIDWHDPLALRDRFLHAPEDSFEELPLLAAEADLAMGERGDAFLSLVGSDPELLAGVDPNRVQTAQAAAGRARTPFRRLQMANRIPWTILAHPTPEWAAQVHPELPPKQALSRLWDEVLAAARCDRDDPVAAWRLHLDALRQRSAILNERRYRALRFRGDGTDLTVGLADGHVWMGGAADTPDGTRFTPNLPTEEVFTAPHRDRVDGVVTASLPLFHAGRRIDGIRLRFEAGRVTEASATSGEEALLPLLDTDEGARRLGEVALVAKDSPIRRTGTLFRNTLFDENAASHLALGQGYAFCLGEGVADPAAAGLNESVLHVDFMVGADDTDVDGVTADGREEAVMRQGSFVIDAPA